MASGTDKYLQEVGDSPLQRCNTLAEHESDSIPMGPTGAWWKRPLRAACSILWWRSGCQEPNKVSLFWRLPCRSLSCRWSAPTLFVASVTSVLQVQSRNYKGRIQVRQFCHSTQWHKDKLKHWQQQHSKNTTWSEFAIFQIVPQLSQLGKLVKWRQVLLNLENCIWVHNESNLFLLKLSYKSAS